MISNNIDRIVWAVCVATKSFDIVRFYWWFSNINLYLLAKGTKRKLKDSGKLSKKVKLADLDSDDDEDDEDYEEDMSALDFLDDEASEEEEDSDDMCKIKLGCSYCLL